MRLNKPSLSETKMFSFYQHEVVSTTTSQTTVPIEKIDRYPFESQCRSALSTLIVKAENSPNKFHYTKFPFGLLDTKVLKELLLFYDRRAAYKRTIDEKKWLSVQHRIPHVKLDVHMPTGATMQLFSSIWSGTTPTDTKQIACARNLIGTQWLTDTCTGYIANLINSPTSSALCVIAQYSKVMFNTELLAKLEKIRLRQDVVQDIFILLNVGKTEIGETNIALEGGTGDFHWALLFFNVGSSTWYYGDSLAWQFPSNTHCLVSLLKKFEDLSGLGLLPQNIRCELLHDPYSKNDQYIHDCRGKCKPFNPTQSCSSVCGVVCQIMAALLSQSKSLWPNSTDIPQKVLSINNASMYSDFLRKILLEWTINQHIDTQVFFY